MIRERTARWQPDGFAGSEKGCGFVDNFDETAIASNREMAYNDGRWHAPEKTRSTLHREPPSLPGAGPPPSSSPLSPRRLPTTAMKPSRSAGAAAAADDATRKLQPPKR